MIKILGETCPCAPLVPIPLNAMDVCKGCIRISFNHIFLGGEEENLPGLPKEEVTALANQYVKDKNSFKVDFPHLLYIQKGQEVRAPITKDLFDAFIKAFHTKLVKMDPKESGKVNILWTEWEKDRGLIACDDEATERIVRSLADNFKHNGTDAYNYTIKKDSKN